jgi:hypothetical protein
MNFKFPRVGTAALVALGLAACSGQSTVPSAAPQSFAPNTASAQLSMHPAHADALIANAASPCNVGKSFWYFRGTCVEAKIKSSPNKLILAPYKGLKLTLGFPKSDAANAVFLVGDGTSSADITGQFVTKTAKTKFIDYGTVPCVNLKGKETKCVGKAFLYVLLANASSSTVDFPNLPTATITTSGQFPGTKKCGVIGMGFDQNGDPAGRYILGANATPQGNKVSLPAPQGKFTFGSNNFTILGYICQ